MTEETQTDTTVSQDSSLLESKDPVIDFSAGKPEGFPDDYWDAEKNTPAVDKLYQAYQNESKRAAGLRAKLSRGEFEGKPPEDIKEYVVELDDATKGILQDDDPIFNAAREAAKQVGLPKEMFGKFMAPVISKIAELSKDAATPPSPEEIEAARSEEIAKLGVSGQKIVAAVRGFGEDLKAKGILSDSEFEAFKSMATTAEQVKVLNRLRSMLGGQEVPMEVTKHTGPSVLDIQAKLAQAAANNDENEYNKWAAELHKLTN